MATDKPETPAESPKPTPKDNLVITHHTVTINSQEIHYTVTTGTMVLKEETTIKVEKEGEFAECEGVVLRHAHKDDFPKIDEITFVAKMKNSRL